MPDQKFVSLDEFHALSARDAEGVAIRSEVFEDVEAKDDSMESRRLTFTISTASVDRQNDKVEIGGWDLKSYQKNPVVLWAHNYRQIPVARSRQLWKDGDRLKSDDEFTPKGLNDFNDTVFELYRQRFMRATSVGFAPKKWNWNEERKGGIDFLEQELLEHSFVPVPANAEALMDAKSAGIDMQPLKKWAEATLLGLKEPGGLTAVEVLAALDTKGLAAEIAQEIHRIKSPTDERTLPLLNIVARRIEIERFRK